MTGTLSGLAARAAWAPAAVVVLHGILATLFGHPRWLDPAFHLVGGTALAHGLFGVVLHVRRRGPRASSRSSAVTFLLVLALAALWELGELASDLLLGTDAVRGAMDTATDLLLGALGAAPVVVLRHRLSVHATT